MSRVIGKGYDFDDVLIIPKYNKVLSRKDVTFDTQVTKNHKIKIPFIAANMDTICESEMAIAISKLGGLGVIHRFMDIVDQCKQVIKVKKEGLLCAAAIGVKDFKERSLALVDSGVDILVIDIAHGHSKYAGKVLDYLKQTYPKVDIIAGNIATKDAAEYFLSKGADAVKVGIGPGAVCTTRQMTGIGVPQLTAIMDVYEATQGRIPIIADGGIKTPGDVVKALGAGANTVMCGYIFAGCDECPNQNINNQPTGPSFTERQYRGSSSAEVKGEVAFVEGKEIIVNSKGPVKDIIKKYLDGLASGMTYIGAKDLNSLIGKVDYILK